MLRRSDVILGIDTSAGQCAVALCWRGGRAPLRRTAPMERGHAEHLFPMIEAVLEEAGARYADIVAVGVCTGPGSFTGIRVGVAAARGLALGLGIAARGIDRCAALALPRLPDGSQGEGVRVEVALLGPRETVYRTSLLGPLRTAVASPITQIPCARLTEPRNDRSVCVGDAWPGADTAAGLPDPADVAALSQGAFAGISEPAVPTYVRAANADPPRQPPLRRLDVAGP